MADWTVIVASETKSEKGEYPHRVVLVKRDPAPCPKLPFSTHMQIFSIGSPAPDYQAGHYDLTLTEACADFQERCKAHEVKYGEAYGQGIAEYEKEG